MCLDPDAAEEAIRFVLKGGIFISNLPADRPIATAAGLTPRERQVAALIRIGTPNKIIAYELRISEATVKVFVRCILAKLGVRNRTQIAFRLQGKDRENGVVTRHAPRQRT